MCACVCPVIYLVVVVVVVAGMRRRRSNLVSRFVVVAALSLLPTGTFCVCLSSHSHSLTLRDCSSCSNQLNTLVSCYCCCLPIDIAILTHSHTLWHSLALEVIILARLLLLATRRRRNAAAAELHGNVSKQQLRSNGTKSTVGTLWEMERQRTEKRAQQGLRVTS